MRLRTALRVMERIAHAEDGVATREDLYAFAGSVDWSSHLSLRNTVKCDCTLGQV
jgi:23S rRNA G2445 N2-methylase RlmL